MSQWNYWWDQLLYHYQVNPLVFVVMYACKSVVFWWLVIRIVLEARRRHWEPIPGLILSNVAVNVSPWVYVWIFGRNLPAWYPYMVYFLAGWGLVYLVMHVRKKLRQHPGPGPVLFRRRSRNQPLPEAPGAQAP